MDSSIPSNEVTGRSPDRLMDIGQLRIEFKRLRIARKRTQANVAEELGITQASLSAWETGKNQSLRTRTLNEVIHLVDTWRADSNILQIPAGRIKAASATHDQPIRKASSPAKDRAREKMIRAIKLKQGSDAPSADILADLSWKDLLEIFILSKME